jgi:hypothetical protein
MDATDPELLGMMLRIGDTELSRESRLCLLVTLSRFAPHHALIDALELLAWEDDTDVVPDRRSAPF